jgi:peptidoglycan-N-acetylglucosamine deacetylase
MNRKRSTLLLLCTFFILFSCKNEIKKPIIKRNIAGVVLSFDDAYINEWFDTNKELKQYDWKGTFFVCKINTLDLFEIKKLLQLQKEGHEIAGHSFNHYNAVDFLTTHSIDQYINQEINPMMDLMQFYGFKVTSFAYPYGGRTRKLDTALLNKFSIVRGRAFCAKSPSKQSCFSNKSRLFFSFSIDDTHNHFNTPYLLKLLDYANKNNKILILNSHKTVKKATTDYQTTNRTLALICRYIKRNNMQFYTLSESSHLN